MTEEPKRFPGHELVEQYLRNPSLAHVDTDTLVEALPEIEIMLFEYEEDPESYERVERVRDAVELELV